MDGFFCNMGSHDDVICSLTCITKLASERHRLRSMYLTCSSCCGVAREWNHGAVCGSRFQVGAMFRAYSFTTLPPSKVESESKLKFVSHRPSFSSQYTASSTFMLFGIRRAILSTLVGCKDLGRYDTHVARTLLRECMTFGLFSAFSDLDETDCLI